MKLSAQISFFALGIAFGLLAFSAVLAQGSEPKKLLEYKVTHRIDLKEKSNQPLLLAERKIYDAKTKTSQTLKGILEGLVSATFNEKSIRFYDPFSLEPIQEVNELRSRYIKLISAEEQEPYAIMPYMGCPAGMFSVSYPPLEVKEAAANFSNFIDLYFIQEYDQLGKAHKKESIFIVLYLATDVGIELPFVAYRYAEVSDLLSKTYYKAKSNDATGLSIAQIIEKGSYTKIVPRKSNSEAQDIGEAEQLYQELINEQEQITQHH